MNWVYGQRAVVAALSAAALLVVGCSSAEGVRDGGKGPSGSAGASAAPRGESPPRIPSMTGLPGWAYSLGFASDGSGFALIARCPNEDEERERGTGCVHKGAVLDHGAKTWRVIDVPVPDTKDDWGVTSDLMLIGPGRALITEGLASVDDRTWFTKDGGRTWRESTTKVTGTAAAVPAGSRLVGHCDRWDKEPDGNEICGRSRLATVLPTTGEYRALASQPPLAGYVQPAGETGRLFFASGESRESGRPALAVSADRGRTWTVSEPPKANPKGWGFDVVSSRAGLFALERGQLPAEETVKNGLLAIYASKDEGRTWQRVWAFRSGIEPRSVLGAVAADDGSLTVYGESGAWTSATGGRTFRPGEGSTGPAGSAHETPLGWLWSDSYGNGTYRISKDGVRWHTFQLTD